MPQDNEANLVDPSENPDEQMVDPSEDGGAAQADAEQQDADQSLGEPTGEGDGPNRWGDGPNR